MGKRTEEDTNQREDDQLGDDQKGEVAGHDGTVQSGVGQSTHELWEGVSSPVEGRDQPEHTLVNQRMKTGRK